MYLGCISGVSRASLGSISGASRAQERAVKDTTGCGDAFAAGFLFGWCGSRDVQRGLVYGCACGSAAVGQVGGSTPLDPTEVDLGMRRNSGAEDIWQSPTDRVPFADLTRVATTGGAAIPDVRKR